MNTRLSLGANREHALAERTAKKTGGQVEAGHHEQACAACFDEQRGEQERPSAQPRASLVM